MRIKGLSRCLFALCAAGLLAVPAVGQPAAPKKKPPASAAKHKPPAKLHGKTFLAPMRLHAPTKKLAPLKAKRTLAPIHMPIKPVLRPAPALAPPVVPAAPVAPPLTPVVEPPPAPTPLSADEPAAPAPEAPVQLAPSFDPSTNAAPAPAPAPAAPTAELPAPAAATPLPTPPPEAPVAAAPEPAATWQRFSRLDGSRGGAHVEAATLLDTSETSLSFSTSYGRGSDVFLPGDTDTLQRQLFGVRYAPLSFLQLGFNMSLTTNTNTSDPDFSAATLGDPRLQVKGRLFSRPRLGLSGLAEVVIPTAAQSAGVNLGGSSLELRLLGSWAALDWLETSVNLGAVIDGRNKVFNPNDYSRVKMFAGRAPVSNRVEYGISAAARFSAKDLVDMGPFVEISGAYGLGAPTNQDPLVLSLGARLAPQQSRRWEFGCGADVRVAGAPEPTLGLAKMPGELPFTLFAQAAVHFNSVETECAGPLAARAGAPDAAEAPAPTGDGSHIPPYSIQGLVVDAGNGTPVREAVVSVLSMPGVRYLTDKQGAFTTPPLDAQPVKPQTMIRLQVQATDYASKTQEVAPSQDGSPLTLRIELTAAQRPSEGSIKGVVLNRVTGKPVTQGFIFLPTLQLRLPIDAHGAFSGHLRAGRHQVLIYAKGYVTQRKDIVISRDDVVIFNIDLAPSAKAGFDE
jgi:hypothetical protein